MNDELDNLSDTALSEVFAVEVAGYEKLANEWFAGDVSLSGNPSFATSPAAVLPYLSKVRWKAQQFPPDGVWIDLDAPAYGDAYAPTFARAACIALIRAKRAASYTPNEHVDAGEHPEDRWIKQEAAK